MLSAQKTPRRGGVEGGTWTWLTAHRRDWTVRVSYHRKDGRSYRSWRCDTRRTEAEGLREPEQYILFDTQKRICCKREQMDLVGVSVTNRPALFRGDTS